MPGVYCPRASERRGDMWGSGGRGAPSGDEIWQYPSYPTVPTNPIGAGDAFAPA